MRTLLRRIAFLCLLFSVGQVFAQPANTIDNSSSVQQFDNARIVIGDGSVVERGSILIRAGTILAVGPSSSMNAPAGTVSYDLTGKTLIPALVNTHAHLGWEAYGDWGSQFFTEENLTDHLYRHAYYGVGTIISTGSDQEDIARRVKLEQKKGNIGGAR